MMLTSATSVERELTRRASIMNGDVGLPWKPSKRRSLKVVDSPLPLKRRRSEPLRSENLVAKPINKCEEGEIQLKVEGSQGSLLENRAAMFEHYQPWVIQTYGDLAKTKTITLKKYERIVRTLGGLERNCLENSKFRFWVRAKGFRVGRPEGYQPKPADGIVGSQTVDPNVEDPPLYVPTAAIKESHEWKKVAVVENFFDIIYCVHVEMEGRPGKHAGQKRTYRTITETYGFLPREAVTKFLMGCTACQRHPRSSSPTLRITSIPPAKPSPKTLAVKPKSLSPKSPSSLQELTLKPRRVAMSKQNTRCVSPTSGRTTWKCRDAGDADDEAESVGKSERGVSPVIGRPLSPLSGAPMKLMTGIVYRDKQLLDSSNIDFSLPITTTFLKHMRSLGYSDEDALKLDVEENVQSTPERDPSEDEHYSGRNGDSLPLRLADGDASNDDVAALWGGYHHAIKKQPDQATETSSLHDETSSSGNKEDEDDEDDEADDKIDSLQFDPERLKAFNMFVRLFVDENLDRIVPISKQPKEKIQAIIDSCTRQFPEFAERARKRIRTYLKSCRRNKRSRDTGQPWEVPSTGRPTPAHLTSVAAEQILAQACENESHNAKRMRLGLEPVGQPLPLAQQQLQQQQQQMQLQHSQQMLEKQQQLQQTVDRRESQYPSPLSDSKPSVNALSVEQLVKTNGAVPGAGAGLGAAPTALYRPNFGQAFQRAGPTYPGPPAMFPGQQPVFNPAQLIGGAPADLSMKTKPLLNHKLSPTEMAAVRQLVTGYRESAAFLLRSADELEQLLLQQQP